MSDIPFHRKIQPDPGKPIVDGFPDSARIGLAYFIKELISKEYIRSWDEAIDELGRIGRMTSDFSHHMDYFDFFVEMLQRVDWPRIYTFCERAYDRLLYPVKELISSEFVSSQEIIVVELSEVKEFYTRELNYLAEEENLGFRFENGRFYRAGRPQTQKNIQRVGTILSDPTLNPVKIHFNKARNFFDQRPTPDFENCVKEAMCSLEACLSILIDNPSRDFTKDVRRYQGNDVGKIPPPISESMIKLFAYRGLAQGVAHASLEGSYVREYDAEFVLSAVAVYITYLVDLFTDPEDVPF